MTIRYKGVLNGSWSKDREGTITAIKNLIYWTNASESAVLISQQPEIPEIGTSHPEDSSLLMTDINISGPTEGDEAKTTKYIVSLTYTRSVEFSDNPIQDRSIAPWRMPPYNISVTPIEVVVPFVKAYDSPGDAEPTIPVLNPVGDAYEDETVEQNVIIRFSYNRPTFSSSWINTYIESVTNSDITVVGIDVPARKGKIRSLSANYITQEDENGDFEYRYWRIDVEIEVSKKEWKKEILIRGLYFLDGTDKFRIYTDDQGNFGKKSDMGTDATPVDEPQRLTETGELYTGTEAEYQTFYDKRELNWGSLNLPSSAT